MVQIAVGLVLFAFSRSWVDSVSLLGLILGVIVLDAGIQAAQVANQSRFLSLAPEARNGVNTVYMIAYSAAGAVGSLTGFSAWAQWPWPGVCFIGIGLMVLAAIVLALGVRDQ